MIFRLLTLISLFGLFVACKNDADLESKTGVVVPKDGSSELKNWWHSHP